LSTESPIPRSFFYNWDYLRELGVIEMDRKTLNIAILVIGIAILLISLFADPIGVGDFPGFGRDQTIGSIVGALVVAVGLFLTVKAK
jgi:hypothetical protein